MGEPHASKEEGTKEGEEGRRDKGSGGGWREKQEHEVVEERRGKAKTSIQALNVLAQLALLGNVPGDGYTAVILKQTPEALWRRRRRRRHDGARVGRRGTREGGEGEGWRRAATGADGG